LELSYGDGRTFALLTLLFPFIDLQNHFHEDHVFPRSRFGKVALRRAGVPEELVEDWQTMRDGVANLQLLNGAANLEKQAQMPRDWLQGMFADATRRASYCEQHLLGEVPADIAEFATFYSARRERLRTRLETLLGRSGGPQGEGAEVTR
jgi:hypothetical protein